MAIASSSVPSDLHGGLLNRHQANDGDTDSIQSDNIGIKTPSRKHTSALSKSLSEHDLKNSNSDVSLRVEERGEARGVQGIHPPNCTPNVTPIHKAKDAAGSSPPSPADDVLTLDLDPNKMLTSTPVVPSTSRDTATSSVTLRGHRSSLPAMSDISECDSDLTSSLSSSVSTQTVNSENNSDNLKVPIVGYEIMEERSKFTVYKIAVQKGPGESWFIFRRYNDFLRLNDRLKEQFPHFRLSLPPKKWLGDNFDTEFLDDRLKGLQGYLSNVVSHRDAANSEPVCEFLCFEDPPGPHDSLEESRAYCEYMEQELYKSKELLQEGDSRIALLEEELALHKAEVENLRKSLRYECTIYSQSLYACPVADNNHIISLVLLNLLERALNVSRHGERASPISQRSECSLPEHDQESYTEADRAVTTQETDDRSLSGMSDIASAASTDSAICDLQHTLKMTKISENSLGHYGEQVVILP